MPFPGPLWMSIDALSLLNDTISGGQPEAVSALALGREERFEDATLRFFIHPRSRIGHFDFDGAAVESGSRRRQLRMRAESGGDREGAARRHGVSRVQHDVEQDLAEMPFIHEDREAFARAHGDRDVVRQEPPVRLDQRRQELVKVQARRRTHLRPAERQQLARQVPAPFGGGVNVLDPLAHPLRIGLIVQHLGPAEHDLEGVVEVVRHTARQSSDGVELLRLQKPLLSARELILRPLSQHLFGSQLIERLSARDGAIPRGGSRRTCTMTVNTAATQTTSTAVDHELNVAAGSGRPTIATVAPAMIRLPIMPVRPRKRAAIKTPSPRRRTGAAASPRSTTALPAVTKHAPDSVTARTW